MSDSGPHLEFSWDPAKAASNLSKHGVAFSQAATVFLDTLAVSVFDEDHSMSEDRWFTLGTSADGRLLAVSHTYVDTSPNHARIRIMSARTATRRERRQYEDR